MTRDDRVEAARMVASALANGDIELDVPSDELGVAIRDAARPLAEWLEAGDFVEHDATTQIVDDGKRYYMTQAHLAVLNAALEWRKVRSGHGMLARERADEKLRRVVDALKNPLAAGTLLPPPAVTEVNSHIKYNGDGYAYLRCDECNEIIMETDRVSLTELIRETQRHADECEGVAVVTENDSRD